MTPEELDKAIARLFEGQDLLTGKVADLGEQVAEIGEHVTELTEDVTVLSDSVKTMRKEAAADRRIQREAIAEMRAAVGSMVGIAESLTSNVVMLTEAQQGTRRRVEKLETRVAVIEKRDRPPKNGPKR